MSAVVVQEIIRQFHERIEKLEETEESASEDCQGVHSLVSDDGIRWVCGMCGYEETDCRICGGVGGRHIAGSASGVPCPNESSEGMGEESMAEYEGSWEW